MENSKSHKYQSDLREKNADPFIPEVDEGRPVDDEKTEAYMNRLKTYLISGKKTAESLTSEVYPIQYALHHRGDRSNGGYPFFYDSENDALTGLYPILENLVKDYFDEESSAIIHSKLPNLFAGLQQNLQEDDNGIAVQPLVEDVVRSFQSLDLPEKDTLEFGEKMDKLRQELSGRAEMPFAFTGKTALQLLNLQNKKRGDLKSGFLNILKKAINGLNELLILHGNDSNLSDVHLDFAEDLISFDKIRDVTVSSASSQISKSSLTRLRSALQTLTSAQKYYAKGHMTIFTSEEVMNSFDLERIFDHVNIEVASANPCRQASLQSKKDKDEFVKTIAALKMGNLMIDQKYDEALHDDYFDHFDLTHLTADDLKYLPPSIVIEDARRLVLQSNDLLSLLSKNSFVKVLSLNHLDDLFDINNQDEPDYLELASLAIFQRNSYVFQGGIDRPSFLKESYRKGLEYPGAVFWNILIPSPEIADDHDKYIALNAAIESRYFPRIEYEAGEDHFVSHHIDLQNNPDPDSHFATCEQKVKASSGMETLALSFTIADFLAMDSRLKETLEIMPPMFRNSHLIPLNEYLSRPEDSISDKIPFIWLLDDRNKLRQAAIPVYWIQQCRNRLEYWTFLQSISGINKDAMEEVKADWERAKNKEIEALKSALQEQYEKERAGDIEKAIKRMIKGLLNQEGDIESVLTEISSSEFKPFDKAGQDEKPPEKEPLKEEKEESTAVVHEEVWVESDECTSCRDCVDALPGVFKYNENKQAYVHNPKGGTFAQIVKAAERCPARCIHPGMPQNKNEESLEKWIKRAEKFN